MYFIEYKIKVVLFYTRFWNKRKILDKEKLIKNKH